MIMNLRAKMAFADEYTSLGDAVIEQLKQLINGKWDDINPSAVDLIRERLGGFDFELDRILADYETQQRRI